VKAVSEMLGHSSTTITQDLYGHTQPTIQRQVADAFDRLLGAGRAQNVRSHPIWLLSELLSNGVLARGVGRGQAHGIGWG